MYNFPHRITTSSSIHTHIVVTVSFEQAVYSFDENIGTGEVCLVKDAETPGQVSVTVRTTDGTAIGGCGLYTCDV